MSDFVTADITEVSKAGGYKVAAKVRQHLNMLTQSCCQSQAAPQHADTKLLPKSGSTSTCWHKVAAKVRQHLNMLTHATTHRLTESKETKLPIVISISQTICDWKSEENLHDYCRNKTCLFNLFKVKQSLDRPWGFQEVEVPWFQDSRHMKVVRLSALCTGRLYPPGNIPGTHFC
jgi:hypothetical protein